MSKPISLSSASEASSLVAIEIGIGFVIGMPLRAVRSGADMVCARRSVFMSVLKASHQFQVARAHTFPRAALMVPFMALWRFANKKVMGLHERPSDREDAVAEGINVAGPQPAIIGLSNLRPEAGDWIANDASRDKHISGSFKARPVHGAKAVLGSSLLAAFDRTRVEVSIGGHREPPIPGVTGRAGLTAPSLYFTPLGA